MDVRTVARRVAEGAGGGRPGRAAALALSGGVIARSGLFDRAWYELQLGRRFRGDSEALGHYLARGRRAGWSPSRLFEPSWFAPSGWHEDAVDPFARFLMSRATGSPHPWVDLEVWSGRNPDAPRGAGPLLAHLLTNAVDTTELPVPVDRAAALAAPLTWGAARSSLDRWAGGAAGRRGVADRPREVDHLDEAADAAFVAARRPPAAAPGGGPLVTVVMPVRDRATTVLAAVASVRAQTLQDWELVVVDDGSVDATPEVLEQVAASDPRVVVVRGPRRGVSAARNAGVACGRGGLLAFLDSDNLWVPHFLATAVAALQERGAGAGYASSRLVTPQRERFRVLDAGEEQLAVRNHVDLNVLVLRRELFDRAGGFDESLLRTVDYDLVWRVARLGGVIHLPFVGVVYDDDGAGPDRITVRELFSWKDVVRARHLVDWGGLEGPRRAGALSALVVVREGWSAAWSAARAVLDDPGAEPGTREVVLVDAARHPGTGRVLHALSQLDSRVDVVTAPDQVSVPLGIDVGLPACTGEHVLLLAEDAVVPPGGAGRLVDALADDSVRSAQALLVDWRDVVVSAGWGCPPGGGVPSRMLADHPREDARAAGPEIRPTTGDGAALLVRTHDLVRLRGADALHGDHLWDVDLGLRLLEGHEDGRHVVRTDVEVVLGDRGGRAGPEPTAAQLVTGRRALLLRHHQPGHAGPSDEEVIGGSGFLVARREPEDLDDVPAHLQASRPVVVRRPRAQVREGTPALRWSLRTATPPGAEGLHWGDLHFAEALASALRALGQEVVVDGRASLRRETRGLEDVTLGVRGKIPLPPQPGAVNLLWVISHPDTFRLEEVFGHDVVLAASVPWADEMSGRTGRPVGTMLQATDPERFHPDVLPGVPHGALFVGNSRGVYRSVVRHVVEAGLDVSVYGGGWDGLLPPGAHRGMSIPNELLAGYYSGAEVVLNDHWDDMRVRGFASNRLFDAAACGARVVSDHVDGLDEVFGDLVRTYRNSGELLDLVRAGAAAFPGEERRLALAARVRKEHSFAARAEELLGLALEVRRSRAHTARRP